MRRRSLRILLQLHAHKEVEGGEDQVNWKILIPNVIGSALATWLGTKEAGANDTMSGIAAALALITNLVGLFQPQPHKAA
jgi:hypothetical protein